MKLDDKPVEGGQVASEKTTESEVADLDTLLAQYDDEPQPVVKPETPAAKPDEVADLRARLDRQETDTEIGIMAGKANLDSSIIEPYLVGKVSGDPRLSKAWAERQSNPKQWSDVRNALVEEAKKVFKVEESPDDENEIAAAVTGSSSVQPPRADDVDPRTLPKDKWNEFQKEHGVMPFGQR